MKQHNFVKHVEKQSRVPEAIPNSHASVEPANDSFTVESPSEVIAEKAHDQQETMLEDAQTNLDGAKKRYFGKDKLRMADELQKENEEKLRKA